MRRGTAKMLVRLYPRAWRERYGAEFTALLEERRGGFGGVIDVAWSAMRERIAPTVGGSMEQQAAGPVTWRESAWDAARYWERRRLIYNAVLCLVCGEWVLATWPHFRPAMHWATLLPVAVLGLLANVCFTAAYAVDVPLRRWVAGWVRWRWLLMVLGTAFALLLANYWIGDEIYPYVR